MMGFRCIPMDTESAIRFRQTRRDDAGNLEHRKIADHSPPCRHCLAEAEIGAPLLLGSYHFGRPYGVYWTPSPIFGGPEVGDAWIGLMLLGDVNLITEVRTTAR